MDHAAIECARCGVHLPLKRDLAVDRQQVSWLCANCGWQMPGVLDPAARDSISGNVAPVAPPAIIEIRRRDYWTKSEPLLKKLGRYFLSSGYAA